MPTQTSASSPGLRGRIPIVMALVSLLLLIITLLPLGIKGMQSKIQGIKVKKWISLPVNDVVASPHRKLLAPERSVDNPTRFWGDTSRCIDSSIQVYQGAGTPLPSGIPTFTVEISNSCVTGCEISNIHIHCGWFSSARLIDPSIFKRIHYNDCLVNGGRPLRSGQLISFEYANIRSFPLSVATMSCV